MCQDLGKCIGQSGLILLIKDGSRAGAGGCSLTPRHVKTSRTAWGSTPYNEGPHRGGGVWNMWQDSRPPGTDMPICWAFKQEMPQIFHWWG